MVRSGTYVEPDVEVPVGQTIKSAISS